MWSGNDSGILQYEDEFLVANGYPVNKDLQTLVYAITGMTTENGYELRWESTTPLLSGPESVDATGAPLELTILMYQGSPLPLASLE